jgi:hypothetical protein
LIYEIDLPFVAGLKEYYSIPLFSAVLRRCGGYMIDKSKIHD